MSNALRSEIDIGRIFPEGDKVHNPMASDFRSGALGGGRSAVQVKRFPVAGFCEFHEYVNSV